MLNGLMSIWRKAGKSLQRARPNADRMGKFLVEGLRTQTSLLKQRSDNDGFE